MRFSIIDVVKSCCRKRFESYVNLNWYIKSWSKSFIRSFSRGKSETTLVCLSDTIIVILKSNSASNSMFKELINLMLILIEGTFFSLRTFRSRLLWWASKTYLFGSFNNCTMSFWTSSENDRVAKSITVLSVCFASRYWSCEFSIEILTNVSKNTDLVYSLCETFFESFFLNIFVAKGLHLSYPRFSG